MIVIRYRPISIDAGRYTLVELEDCPHGMRRSCGGPEIAFPPNSQKLYVQIFAGNSLRMGAGTQDSLDLGCATLLIQLLSQTFRGN